MNRQNLEFIRAEVSVEERLAQLAEEATELAHAALKMRRALGTTNPTPVRGVEALAQLEEEVADVQLILETLGICPDPVKYEATRERKLQRWVDRIQATERSRESDRTRTDQDRDQEAAEQLQIPKR